jgi:amino acid transporter
MRTRFFTPQVVKTLVYVVLLIAAAVIIFRYRQPALPLPSWRKSLLFAVKGISTSGVPDDIGVDLEYF